MFRTSLLKRICLLVAAPIFVIGENFPLLEGIYNPQYCLQLESVYGPGFMSEGGEEGIDQMFDQISLKGTKALDLGSGVGGVAFYLAEKHEMQITGLEVSPWMVDQSRNRIPEHLKNQVDFLLVNGSQRHSLAKTSYDIIYSKNFFIHIQAKDRVLKRTRPLLKDEGLLVITDWVTAPKSTIGQTVNFEQLHLFPESESGYRELLKTEGFNILSVRDDSSAFLLYNQKVIERLIDLKEELIVVEIFTEAEWQHFLKTYEFIAKALEAGELKVLRFVVEKNPDF